MKCILLLVFCTLVFSQQAEKPSPNDIRKGLAARDKLLKNITANRDASMIPTIKGAPINVEVGIQIIKVVKYSRENGALIMSGWLSLKWNDPLLKWNPKDHQGIQSINVPSKYIWTPDIVPYNTLSKEEDIKEFQKIILSSGDVMYIPQVTFVAFCSKMSRHHVSCNNSYGSWTFDKTFVNLTLGQLSHYKDSTRSHRFKIHKISGNIEVKYYPCCKEAYPKMNVHYIIRHRGHHHTIFWSLPLPNWMLVMLLVPFFYLIPAYKSARIIIIGINLCILFLTESSLMNNMDYMEQELSYFFKTAVGLNMIALIWSFWGMYMLTRGYQLLKSRLVDFDMHKGTETNTLENMFTFNTAYRKIQMADLILGSISCLFVLIIFIVYYAIMP